MVTQTLSKLTEAVIQFQAKDGAMMELAKPIFNDDKQLEFLATSQNLAGYEKVVYDFKEKALKLYYTKKKVKRCISVKLINFYPQLKDQLDALYSQFYEIMQGYMERLKTGKEKIYVYVVDGKCSLFMPTTQLDYLGHSTKFNDGFTYYVNSYIRQNLTYDQVQQLLVKAYDNKRMMGKDHVFFTFNQLMKQLG
ncbi:hypothetical protein ACOMCU_01915 [Lysinibacillus sp. UGB7]|uniref:hypothetical protein n=1 Tax=Lysinibacillus sp. UGB7 TaxID=3411039 RepID=UPI003B7ADAC0